jgi:hypothetical protein
MHRFKMLLLTLPFTFSMFTSTVAADLSAPDTSSVRSANFNSVDISTNHSPTSIPHNGSSILTRRNPNTQERMGGGLGQIIHMILHSVLHVASHAMAHGLMHAHECGHFPEHIFCDAEINCLKGMLTNISYSILQETWSNLRQIFFGMSTELASSARKRAVMQVCKCFIRRLVTYC